MIALLGDENFDARITAGLKRRIPGLDAEQAQALGIRRLPDPELLALVWELQRVVLTHDRRTMIRDAYARIADGLPLTGLIYVPDWLGVGRALDELELLLAASHDHEIIGVVRLLPLDY